MGFILLAFVALVITNVGATAVSGVNLNPNLFFGHQTIESSSFETTQTGNIDYQQINVKNSILGIDNIVSIAETSDWYELELEDGSLTVEEEVLPQGKIPLCVNQTWLDQYYVIVYSYGGYEPVSGMSYIRIVQGEDKWDFDGKMKTYKIWVDWTLIPEDDPDYSKDCCADAYYNATFRLMPQVDKICFDAENYPVDALPQGWTWEKWYCTGEIPGKDVQFLFNTTWSGCKKEDQYFTLISIREKNQFPNN